MCRRHGSSKKAGEMSQQLRTLSVLSFPSPHCGLNDVLWTYYMVPRPREVEPTVLSATFSHCYFLPLYSRYWMRRSSLNTAFRLITAVWNIPCFLSPTVCSPWPSITQHCLMANPVSTRTQRFCKRTYLMLVTYFFTSFLLVEDWFFSSSGIQASGSLQFEALSSGIQSPLHWGGTGGRLVRRHTRFLKCLLEEAHVISCC